MNYDPEQQRQLFRGTSGPVDSRIVLVGEAWGAEEAARGKPFVGQSGQELDRMLAEAGLDRDRIFVTNTVAARPPGNELARWFNEKQKGVAPLKGLFPSDYVRSELVRLQSQLAAYPRDLVILAGNYPLWALTDKAGTASKKFSGIGSRKVPTKILTYRGSMEHIEVEGQRIRALPIAHPSMILRQWEYRHATVQDLKRAHNLDLWDTQYTLHTPKDRTPFQFAEACRAELLRILVRAKREQVNLAVDIETKFLFITCIGWATSDYEGWSFPLFNPPDKRNRLVPYLPPEAVASVLKLLFEVMCHPNVKVIGQNFDYDKQLFHHWFGFDVPLNFDTMLAQHLVFPGMPKGLDYLASMYCEHYRYWKEDGKEWDVKGDLNQHLEYNALDCCKTHEVARNLEKMITHFDLWPQWESDLGNEKYKYDLALSMMQKGVKIYELEFSRQRRQVGEKRDLLSNWFRHIIPMDLIPKGKGAKAEWWDSPTQICTFLYDILKLPVQRNRKTGSRSSDDEALTKLKELCPELGQLFDNLLRYRSLGVFYNNFLAAKRSSQGRWHTQYKTSGTETFRWSSTKNVFGLGTNMQNIPAGDED